MVSGERIKAGSCRSVHSHSNLPWVELDAGSRDLSLSVSGCKERVMRICHDTVLFLLPYPVGYVGQPRGFAWSQNMTRKPSKRCGSGGAKVYRNAGDSPHKELVLDSTTRMAMDHNTISTDPSCVWQYFLFV